MNSSLFISFHPHKLTYIKDDKKIWYCHSLNHNKKCYRDQTKTLKIWGYRRYFCEERCDFFVCDTCAWEYRRETEE